MTMIKRRSPVVHTISGERRKRTKFAASLRETAAKAAVTATVSFAVGWALKKMLEGSVAEAAKEGAQEGVKADSAQEGSAVTGQEREKMPSSVPAQ